MALRLDANVKAVRSLIGAQVRHEKKDEMVLLELPLLDLYDSIVVEYT